MLRCWTVPQEGDLGDLNEKTDQEKDTVTRGVSRRAG